MIEMTNLMHIFETASNNYEVWPTLAVLTATFLQFEGDFSQYQLACTACESIYTETVSGGKTVYSQYKFIPSKKLDSCVSCN